MNENTHSLLVMDTVKTAWDKVYGIKGTFFTVLGIYILGYIVLKLLMLLFSVEPSNLFSFVLFNITMLILQIIGSGSFIYLGVRRAQDTPISYKLAKDVLNAGTIFSLIGLYILQTIIFIPVFIVGSIGLVIGSGILDISAVLRASSYLFYGASAFLFIYLSARMWLSYGGVVDKNYNPLKALVSSFKATRGNALKLIGLFIISLVIIFVCAITFGIGFIWGFPWLFIIYGESYKSLFTTQDKLMIEK